MFDILPSEAIPESVAVADGMQSAVAEARRSFRKLPRTPERDSVLNTLGRVGKPNLKRKVRFRAKVILDELGGGFDGLCEVTDEAVNCRNHYVHGTDSPIDYNRELGTRFFLTDTLEFVFAASDLVEAGWDIGKWIRERPGQFHPFGMYRLGYQENRKKLESLL